VCRVLALLLTAHVEVVRAIVTCALNAVANVTRAGPNFLDQHPGVVRWAARALNTSVQQYHILDRLRLPALKEGVNDSVLLDGNSFNRCSEPVVV